MLYFIYILCTYTHLYNIYTKYILYIYIYIYICIYSEDYCLLEC